MQSTFNQHSIDFSGEILSQTGSAILDRKTLAPLGKMECMKRHEQVWLQEPDNPEREDRARLLRDEHNGVANRTYKKRIARHYAVAMHKRFGRFALETFWVHGVVDEAICDALRATAPGAAG